MEEIFKKFGRVSELPPKTVFINQGDVSDFVYYIVSGSVQVYRVTEEGRVINLSLLGPGEVVGEMSFLESEERSASVETLTDIKLLIITRDEFEKILSSDPKLALGMLKNLSKRLRETDLKLEETMSINLEEKVLKTLKALSKYFPSGDITLSHEELADIIGASRARVTGVLDKFEKQGKIILSHKKIKLVPQRTDVG